MTRLCRECGRRLGCDELRWSLSVAFSPRSRLRWQDSIAIRLPEHLTAPHLVSLFTGLIMRRFLLALALLSTTALVEKADAQATGQWFVNNRMFLWNKKIPSCLPPNPQPPAWQATTVQLAGHSYHIRKSSSLSNYPSFQYTFQGVNSASID